MSVMNYVEGRFRFEFPAMANRNYQIQTRPSVTDRSWTVFAEIPAEDNGRTETIDAVLSGTKLYFRFLDTTGVHQISP